LHYWSLCIEIHFYVLIGITMAVTRFRAFPFIPLALLAVTVNRIINDPHRTMLTHFRIDEILSGCCLALIYLGLLGEKPRLFLVKTPAWVFLVGLCLTCHYRLFPLDWFRGYFASALIGHTLFMQDSGRYDVLKHRWLKYIAETSYAIYVIHPATISGWFSEGPKVIKYLKRPISLTITLAASHLSTRYWERPWMNAGKRWVKQWESRHRPAEIATTVIRSGVHVTKVSLDVGSSKTGSE
jgi:peptidoglycan/LPS O-acetylase OafA/YrhL